MGRPGRKALRNRAIWEEASDIGFAKQGPAKGSKVLDMWCCHFMMDACGRFVKQEGMDSG